MLKITFKIIVRNNIKVSLIRIFIYATKIFKYLGLMPEVFNIISFSKTYLQYFRQRCSFRCVF